MNIFSNFFVFTYSKEKLTEICFIVCNKYLKIRTEAVLIKTRNDLKPPETILNQLKPLRNYLAQETLAQVFSCEFCEIFKNTFFTEHLQTYASVCKISVDLLY